MTEWGRKRTIDQSSCNKDYSCVKGFCPSFVTVHGAKLKHGESVAEPSDWPALPAPSIPLINHPYGIIVTGVGGTGIVTVGAIIGMAANLEGKGAGMIDMAGLAQKGGAVYSHIRIANAVGATSTPFALPPAAPTWLSAATSSCSAARRCWARSSRATPRSSSTRPSSCPAISPAMPTSRLPTERLKRAITGHAGPGQSHFIDAGRLATALLGNSIGANMFMLGYAYQLGALPLSADAVEKAIEMNGEAVAMNVAAFRYGRRAAVDPAKLESLVKPQPELENDSLKLSQSFDETVERRVAFLTAYQSARYARRYRTWVEKIRALEAAKVPGQCGLAESVARYLFKLMAYKDEYEVARLYSDTSFIERVKSSFDGNNLRFEFHLAPPLLARHDKTTGEPKKMSFGPWMLKVFGVLSKFKFLRGTPLDPFGYTQERRTERQLVADYEKLLGTIEAELTPYNHQSAVALAALPEKIRGFGPVKMRHLAIVRAEESDLYEHFRSGAAPFLKAAE